MLKNKRIFSAGFLFIFFLVCPPDARATQYVIDPVFSSVLFKVQHLTGYTVGLFKKFSGFVELNDDNNAVISIDATVNVKSVYTQNNRRDIDMRGPDIFDAAKFPTAKFKTKKIEPNPNSPGQGKLIGDLTLKGKTKEVVFDYGSNRVSRDSQNLPMITLLAKGTINRKDFDITYNRKLDSGEMLLGENVELTIEIRGVPKQ